MQRVDELDPEPSRRQRAMAALHDALSAGDASRVDLWLRAGLASARFAGGTTPLMLAATHPDARAAVRMVDVVLEHGADLHASDDCKRDVLMHACRHGAHASVIDRVLQRNEELGGWQLAWRRRDRDGADAVALASRGGHGKLAAHLLDHALDLEAQPLENYPLKVLEAALDANDEASALDVLASATIQRAVGATGEQMEVTRNPWQRHCCTVYSCVDAAIKNSMERALDAMMALNRQEVARAAWYSLRSMDASALLTVAPEVKRVGDQYRSDRIWECVKVLVLLRHRGLERQLTLATPTSTRPQSWRLLLSPLLAPWTTLRDAFGGRASKYRGETLAARLATLPDPIFHLLARFLVPLAAEELEQIRFWLDARRCRRCGRLCIPGECRSASIR